MFLDTGAGINLISLDFLRKTKPGLVIIEPTTFNIRGVTGNCLTPVGETEITVTFGNYYMIELKAVVVVQQAFPGNLLIGYDTMHEDDIIIFPAKEGVAVSYKFLPFVNTSNRDFVAPVSQHRTTEANTVPSVNTINNVALLYLNHSSPVPDEKHIPTSHHEATKSRPTPKKEQAPCSSRYLENCFRFCNRVDAVASTVNLQGKG